MLQDMGVAACENLVPVPLQTRGRGSHLEENPFNQWCTTEDTISFFNKQTKKGKKRILGITELKCAFLRFGGPPLNSWDILDLEITHLYQGLLSFTS